MGDREWFDEYWRLDKEGKEAMLLGKGTEGICNRVMEDVGECKLYWLGRWWQKRKQLLYEWVVVGYWSSSLLLPLFRHEQLGILDLLTKLFQTLAPLL